MERRQELSGFKRASSVCAAAALALCASLVLAAPGWGWGTIKVTPIAKGLDNPRDLDFGPDGKLYVAEAGHGGKECFKTPPHEVGEEEETTCFGFTSGISRIDWNGPHKVLSGLFSQSEEGGGGALGIDAISFSGGRLYGLEGGSAPQIPSSIPGVSPATIAGGKAEAGHLGFVDSHGHIGGVVDVGSFDFNWTQEHKELVPEQFPDANPYAVLALPQGELILDAAANTLEFVSPSGSIKVLAFIPNPPVSDAVPTCLAKGPDGAIYMGQLVGAGNKEGAGAIWRWTPGHFTPEKVASGLGSVTGCGFGPDGQFYAVEFSTKNLIEAAPGTGAVVRVAPHSTSPTTIASGLNFPGGFAAGRDAIYVSQWIVAPADNHGGPTGEVLRISRG